MEKIWCAPGNAGIAAQAECVAIKETEVERLRDFAAANEIGLTVVGPEVALVNAGAESVHTLHDALARRQLLAPEGTGQALLCTSDRPEGFGQMARRFLQKQPTAPVRLVDIERY